MSKDVFVKLKGLSKNFNLKPCIKDVNLEIPEGIKVAVVGPYASGKTTLLRLIAGFYKNHEGTVTVDDIQEGVETKRLISFLPDVDALPYQFKIKDIEKIYCLGDKDFNLEKFNRLLEEFEINKNAVARTLTKEQREWFRLILFLSRSAKLFIMDISREESVIKEKFRIREFIKRELPEDATLIYAATQEKWIDELADAIIYIDEGTVQSFDYKSEYIEKYGSIKEFVKWMKTRGIEEEDEDE